MRIHRFCTRLVAGCGLLLAAAAPQIVHAQPGHDAFDKVLGYDNGREERAAHNYLNQTGTEDTYGESQIEPNQENLQYPAYNAPGSNNFGRRAYYRQRPGMNGQSNQPGYNVSVHHAALGITLHEDNDRVTVANVIPGSPAAQAGLRPGDEIRFVGEQRIRTAHGLADEIDRYRPGSEVELAIRRNGQKQTVEARLESPQVAFRDQSRMNSNRGNSQGQWQYQDSRPANQANNQMAYNQNRGRTAYSRDSQQSQQQVHERVHQLEQQVSQLQQELNDLRASIDGNR